MLILSGVTIATLSGDSGIVNNAILAKISTEFADYKEKVEIYKTNKILEDIEFNEDTLTAGKTTLTYENKLEENGNIKTIITDLSDKYLDKFIIIKGELYLMATGEITNTEVEAAKLTGIEIMPYEITEEGELLSSNVNLALQGGNGIVVIPEIVTSIGNGAFSGVEGLKTITIPGTVKVIGSDAFSYNTTLENVIIEDGVEEIGMYAFKGCTALKSVIMTDSVKTLGQEAFRQCSSLEEVRLSNNITEIKQYTFNAVSLINTIDLPQNLIRIEQRAFDGCTKLNNIEIGKNVIEISSSAFSNCSNLSDLIVDKENKSFLVINDILYSSDKKKIITLLADNKNIKDLIIEEGVENIETGLFAICKNIESISLPITLKSISGGAFSGVTTLKTINIPTENKYYKVEDNMILSKDGTKLIYATPNREEVIVPEGVKDIESQSIQGENIKTVEFENDVQRLKNIVFNKCTNLQNIILGKNINYINPNFKSWGAIKSDINITIDDENKNFKVKENYIVSVDGKEIITFIKNIKNLKIPEGIEVIGSHAFTEAKTETIELPNTLKEIKNNALEYNLNMKKIDIPSSVEKIGDKAFAQCSNLIEINIDKPENSISGEPWDAPKGLRVVNWNG